MSRPKFLAILLSVFAVACASVLGTTSPRTKGDEIRMSHAVHKDLACEMCHATVSEAKTVDESLLPKEEACLTCHADQKDAKKCGYCHLDRKQPRTYARAEHLIIFSHQAHTERGTGDCGTCHKDLSEYGKSSGEPPTMAGCTSCHNHAADSDDGLCSKCHRDLQKYQLKPIAQFSHRGDFVKQHSRTARSSAQSCAQCHDQGFCADCHAKTLATRLEIKLPENADRDFIHRGDYVARHSIEAKADGALCLRCHSSTYCVSCHALNNRASGALNPRSPHPAGYSMPGPTSHAADARRDIANCASCHERGAQTNCIGCHRTGGIGGNPHPISWGSKHSKSEIPSRTVCLYCHN